MRFFFDTETSGLPNFKAPSHDPCQPFLVEFAGILEDDEEKEVSVFNAIVRPPYKGVIPEEATKLHGITTERALEVGVALDVVVKYFDEMARITRGVVIAHNVQFDLKVMEIAMKMFATTCEYTALMVKNIKPFCTMKNSTQLVNLPPTEKMKLAGFNSPKNPTLGECYKHFFGEKLENTHSALADVRACREIFRAIQRGGSVID